VTGFDSRQVHAGRREEITVTANLYRVVFRDSTVVEERLIRAKSMTKAAKKAAKRTEPGGEFVNWSVYSITLC
jgi:hypothetical protein